MSKVYECVPRSQASIERERKMKETAKTCGPNQRPSYRARIKKYICVNNPCPPGQKEKIVRVGRGRTKPTVEELNQHVFLLK